MSCVENEDKEEAQHFRGTSEELSFSCVHSMGGLKYTCDVLQEAMEAAGIYGSLL